MRRDGSAFPGRRVTFKELSDNLTSVRMRVLEWLVIVMALGVVHTDIRICAKFRPRTRSSSCAFSPARVKLRPRSSPYSRSLSRSSPSARLRSDQQRTHQTHESPILAQPIYRDALLFGKFLAGLLTLAIMLVVLWLMVIGLAISRLDCLPGAEEVTRAVAMLFVTIVYAGVWLALALLFSIIFRSAATAALVALGLWLFLTILWPLISPYLASLFVSDTVATPAELLSHLGVLQAFARVSPGALFGEIVGVLLDSTVRSTQQPLLASLGLALVQPGSVPGAPLPLLQSIEVVWPQTVGMIAGAILLFVIGYVIFQRQEVRA